MKYVVVVGNPIEGISLAGVFDAIEEAQQYADKYFRDCDSWWTVEVNSPEVKET